MIQFKNVTKIYRSEGEVITALKDVSCKIKQGEFACVVGKCGAGKTTLVKLLTGKEAPTRGKVLFKGLAVHTLKLKDLQRLRRQMGVVYQDYKLLDSETVRQNLEYVMKVIGASGADIGRDIPQILQIVDLEHRSNNLPPELSGGEKQRLAVARALCHRPQALLADEPTGNLDIYSTREIIRLFEKIHQMGTTIVLFTHDKKIVDKLKHRVITLDRGKLVRDAPSGKVML